MRFDGRTISIFELLNEKVFDNFFWKSSFKILKKLSNNYSKFCILGRILLWTLKVSDQKTVPRNKNQNQKSAPWKGQTQADVMLSVFPLSGFHFSFSSLIYFLALLSQHFSIEMFHVFISSLSLLMESYFHKCLHIHRLPLKHYNLLRALWLSIRVFINCMMLSLTKLK